MVASVSHVYPGIDLASWPKFVFQDCGHPTFPRSTRPYLTGLPTINCPHLTGNVCTKCLFLKFDKTVNKSYNGVYTLLRKYLGKEGAFLLITILLWLVFGALVGWIAGIIMKSKSSLLMNIVFGIVGSVVGGFIASLIGLGGLGGTFSFNIWNILISIAGACLVIFVVGRIRGSKK